MATKIERAAELTGFWPPFCPNQSCIQSGASKPDGFLRHGHYTTHGRSRRIPRFLCRECRKTMSSQTFDESYRLRMPDLEKEILREIAQGASLRGVARVLGINRKTVSRRLFRARTSPESVGQAAAVSEADRSTLRSARSDGSARR